MGNDENKLISIVIPCYNVSKDIDRCMNSIAAQTIGIEHLMCILVDDASTDDTLNKLYNWEQQYPDSITVIACSENGRQGRARNIGMEYATAGYIGFVDSDDYISPEMYERLYEVAEREDVDIVGCLMQREFQDGEAAWTTDRYEYSNKKICINSIEDRKKYLFSTKIPGGVYTKIYRNTSELLGNLTFPEQLAYEDNYWSSMLLYRVKSIYFMDTVYYHYIIDYHSTIMKKNSEKHMDRLVIELMKIEELQKNGMFAIYHDEIEKDFLEMFFINTVKNIFARFDDIPYELIRIMQQNVLELFPDFEKNRYYDDFNPLQKEFLKMIRADMTDEQIDTLAKAYVDLIDNK